MTSPINASFPAHYRAFDGGEPACRVYDAWGAVQSAQALSGAALVRDRFVAAFRKPADMLGDTVQDVEFTRSQPASSEDGAQGEHDVVGIVLGKEADSDERLGHAIEHRADLGDRRELEPLAGLTPGPRCEHQLVRDDHDGLREIQRWISGGGRNRNQTLAQREFTVRESEILRPKDDRDAIGMALADERRCGIANRADVAAVESVAAGG